MKAYGGDSFLTLKGLSIEERRHLLLLDTAFAQYLIQSRETAGFLGTARQKRA